MAWELSEAMAYYRSQGAPGDQTALVSLLKEIQQEFGSIPVYAIDQIAEAYGTKQSYLKAVIKRIPSLRIAGCHILQMCCGSNCGKYQQLAAAAEEQLRQNPDKFTLRYVPCMRMCGKGPNIKWDGRLYHQANAELIRKLVEEG